MIKTSNRLQTLEERKKQIEVQIQQIKAREAHRQRKQETRRKILVGSYYLERAEREGRLEEVKKAMDQFLTRDYDRALFGLPPITPSARDEKIITTNQPENQRAPSLSVPSAAVDEEV